jgi:hypothetical protein
LHGRVKKAADKIKEEKTEMAQGILNVVAEDPKIKHIPEEMQKTAMKKHGGKESQGKRNQRGIVENLSVGDLVGDCAPLGDEALSFGKV